MTSFWTAWNWNPLIVAVLAFVGWRYMDSVWQLWRRAGQGRGIQQWRVRAFWCGLIVLGIALLSPIDTLGSTSLVFHMIQHLLIMLIAAPLLMLGVPPVALIGFLPSGWRRNTARWWNRQHWLQRLWQLFTNTLTIWVVYALVLWTWHIPALYQAAVVHPHIHMVQHGSFLGVALLFWWGVYHGRVLGVALLFTTALHSSILGMLMTFSNQVWYPGYAAIEDQQLAGLLMWMPGGVVFLIASLLIIWHWLYTMEVNDAQKMA